jgi:hypothetical protein
LGIAITLRQFGWRNATIYWTDRVLALLSFRQVRLLHYVLVCQPLSAYEATRPRSGSLDEVSELNSLGEMDGQLPVPNSEISRRLQQGSVCLVARRGREFKGYLWYHHGEFSEDEVNCTFQPIPAEQSVWDFDVHVQPKYRLSRQFATLWLSAALRLKARGVKWSYSRIHASNIASLRAQASSGAFYCGEAMFLKCFGRQFLRTQGSVQVLPSARGPCLAVRRTEIPLARVLRMRAT